MDFNFLRNEQTRKGSMNLGDILSAEQIVVVLRQIEVLMSQGKGAPVALIHALDELRENRELVIGFCVGALLPRLVERRDALVVLVNRGFEAFNGELLEACEIRT